MSSAYSDEVFATMRWTVNCVSARSWPAAASATRRGGVAAQRIDRLDELVHERGVDEQPARTFVEHLGNRAGAAADDGTFCSIASSEHDAEAFPDRRQAEDVEERHLARGLRPRTREDDVAAAQLAASCSSRSAQLAVADDDALDVGAPRHRAHEERNVLLPR